MKQLKNILVFSLLCILACNVATASVQIGATTSDMRREASSFLLRTDHTQPGDARVFPNLKFKCRGSLEGLLFVAEKGQGYGSNITFQTWGMVNATDTSFTGRLRNKQTIQLADSTMVLDRGDIVLYRASFKEALEFEVEDVLGIEQGPQFGRRGLQYIYDWGPLNYVFSYTTNNTSVFQNGLAITNDYPLVAVVTSDVGCVEGFLSESYLRDFLAKNFNPKVVLPFLGSVSTTPLLQFNSSGSITAWKVEGVEKEDTFQLQLWRLANTTGGGKVYQEVTDSIMTPKSQNYQPECAVYVVDQELVFLENDILAIDSLVEVFLGRAVVSAMESGSGQQSGSGTGSVTPNQTCDNSVPPNAAKLTLSIEPDSADSSFVDPNFIIQPVITNVRYNHSTTVKFSSVIVVLNYSINLSGVLRRWVFTVDESLRPPTSAPQLQVWRKTPNSQEETYIRIASTSATNRITRSSVLGAYELLVNPPVQVKAGDILGLLQDAQGKGQAEVVVLAGTGPDVIELIPVVNSSLNESVRKSQQVHRALPLIAAEVSESNEASPTPTASNRNPVGLTAGILIGVFIGAVVIAVGLFVIIITTCYLVMHEKRHKTQKNGVSKSMTPLVNNYAQRVEQPSAVVKPNYNSGTPVSRDEGAMSAMSTTSGDLVPPPGNVNVLYNHSALKKYNGEQDKISSNGNFNGETDSLSKATENGDTAIELKFE